MPEALSLHDEIARLKAEMKLRRSGDTGHDLAAIAKRLPANYRTVGVRVYNPVRPAWKLQLAWALQLLLCFTLVIFLFATLATGWQHIEAQGTGAFVNAYLVQTLLIQAFACEFREIVNTFAYTWISKEILRLCCCLCRTTASTHKEQASRA
eukprot:4556780-Prymnesium_polylepis.1